MAKTACQRELMWQKPRLECSENRYINVDRKRRLEREGT